MDIKTFQASANSPQASLAALVQSLLDDGRTPDFMALHMSHDLDAHAAGAALGKLGLTSFHGGTSCRGVMTEVGHQTDTGHGIGAFCVFDPEGDYGTGLASFGDNAEQAGATATRTALDAADRAGEIPQIIWLSVTPGQEEAVIKGIESVVGEGVPILGGSAADNAINGEWKVFDGVQSSHDGVIVSVLFPSTRVSSAYQNGYVPTQTTGVITKADGRRVLEIDGDPAAQVYARWTGQAVPQTGSENILPSSTFAPLGRDAFELKGVPYYLLAHPSASNSDGSLDLFANVEPGERLTLMHGDAQELAARAGRVVTQACTASAMAPEHVAGALVVFCGGCMLGVQERMTDVVDGVKNALEGAPFMGVFTFGEQGPLHGQGNRHGNLMVSALVFGK